LKENSAEAAKALATLQDDLQEQMQAIANLNTTLEKEVADIVQGIERVRENARKREAAIKDLASRQIDKRSLQELLETQRKSYEVTTSLLQKKLSSLEKEILELQRQLKISPVPETTGVPTEKKPDAEGSKDTSMPTPGKIIEQGIPE
jgi:chromosome segregation ATPase